VVLQDVIATAATQGRDDNVIQPLCLLFVGEMGGVVVPDLEVGEEHMTVVAIAARGKTLTEAHVLDLVEVVLVGKVDVCVLGDATKERGPVCELETAAVHSKTDCSSDEAVDVPVTADGDEPKRPQTFGHGFRPGQVQA